MRTLAYYWGIAGVILIISSAIYRLTPRVLELQNYSMTIWQQALLILFVLFMLYSEGYKGFHLNFAPRVVARALALRDASSPLPLVLAPLTCMGYVHATRKRKLTAWILTLAIVSLVIVVSYLEQPWRGIVDAGVVLGLLFGVASIVWHWLRRDLAGVTPAISPDTPDSA